MRKLALLTMVAASCAALSAGGLANGKTNQAEAEAAKTRRIMLMFDDSGNDCTHTITGITVTVNGSDANYSAHSKHSTTGGDSYSDYGDYYFFDVPYNATKITDITLTCSSHGTTTYNMKDNDCDDWEDLTLSNSGWETYKIDMYVESNIVKSYPTDPVHGIIALRSYSNYQAWSVGYSKTDLENFLKGEGLAFFATALEGCYSCESSAVYGYNAWDSNTLKSFYDNLGTTNQATVGSYVIDDISGYEYTDPETGDKTTKCTVAQKIAMMNKMKTAGSSALIVSSSSGSSSYIWVIAISSAAILASAAVVVIGTSSKKKKEEKK